VNETEKEPTKDIGPMPDAVRKVVEEMKPCLHPHTLVKQSEVRVCTVPGCGHWEQVGFDPMPPIVPAVPPEVRKVVECIPQIKAWRDSDQSVMDGGSTHAEKCGCALCDTIEKIAALEACYDR